MAANASINIQVTASTQQAQAALAALQAQMQRFNQATAQMNISKHYFSPLIDTKVSSEIKNLDQLTDRLQRGKINAKEYNDIMSQQNRLIEYQQRLVNSSYSDYKRLGNGMALATLDVPTINRGTDALRAQAAAARTHSAALQALGRHTMDVGKNQAFMGRQALLSITAPIAVGMAAPAMAFYGIDKQLTQLTKVYGDASSAAQTSSDEIRQNAMELAGSLNESFGTAVKDTLELQQHFAALGETGKDLDKMTTEAARVMTLGDVGSADAEKYIAVLTQAFDLHGQALADAVNFSNEMENSTSLTLQDMVEAFPKLGPIVKTWGGDIKDAGKLLETFTRTGINAVEGANSVKAIYANLVRPTQKLRDLFEQNFGESLDGMVSRYGGNAMAAIEDISKKMANIDPMVRQNFAAQLFGKEQLARGLSLMDGLANPNKNVEDAVIAGDGELQARADKEIAELMNSASKQFDQVINRAIILFAELGQDFLPFITEFLEKLVWVGENIVKVFSMLPDIIKTGIGYIALLAAAIGPLMLLRSSTKIVKGFAQDQYGKFLGKRADMKYGTDVQMQTSAQAAARLAANGEINAQKSIMAAQREKVRTLAATKIAYEKQAVAADLAMQKEQKALKRAANAYKAKLADEAAAEAKYQKNPNATNKRAVENAANKAKQAADKVDDLSAKISDLKADRDEFSARAQNAERELKNGKNFNSRATVSSAYGGAGSMTPGTPAYDNRQSLQRINSQLSGLNNFGANSQGSGMNIVSAQAAGLSAAQIQAARLNTQIEKTSMLNRLAAADAENIGSGFARSATILTGLSSLLMEFDSTAQKVFAGLATGFGLLSMAPVMAGKMIQGLGGLATKAGNKAVDMVTMTARRSAEVTVNGVTSTVTRTHRLSAEANKRAWGMALNNMKAKAASLLPTFGAWGAGIAAALAVGGLAYAYMTREARKLREENDKITKSVDGWSKVLGYTATLPGQKTGTDGTITETTKSKVEAARDDENLKALADRLKRNSGDYAKVKIEIEQEIAKLRATGANNQQVLDAIDVMGKTANLQPQMLDRLRLQFSSLSLESKTGEPLSSEYKQKLNEIFGQVDYEWLSGDMSIGRQGELRDAINKMLNDFAYTASNSPDKLQEVGNNWGKQLNDGLSRSLGNLTPEMRGKIEEMGGIFDIDKKEEGKLLDMTEYDDEVKSAIKVSNDFMDTLREMYGSGDATKFLFKNVDVAMFTMMSREADIANTSVMSITDAVAKFNSVANNPDLAGEGRGWDTLDDQQKGTVINTARALANMDALDGSALDAAIAAKSFGSAIRTAKEEAAQIAEKKEIDWTIKFNAGGELGEVELSKDQYKGMMSKMQDDMYAEASDIAQDQFSDRMDAMKKDADNTMKSLDEKWKNSDKALKKSQDAERKNFDKAWKEREKRENKVFEDRIKAIEDVQEAEDKLEKERQRNSEREEARLRRIAEMLQSGIDFNFAMAGGNLDEAARIALNNQTSELSFNRSEEDRERGFAKEDADGVRKNQIDGIKTEQDAHMERLQEIRDAEREAMDERLELQQEELDRAREAEKTSLQESLTAKQEAEEQKFQASQKAMQRELDTLKAFIPRNTDELNAHIGTLQGVYANYGIDLQAKGDRWSTSIADSMQFRINEAIRLSSNDQRWREYGAKIADFFSSGSFNMSIEDFNKFIRTGEIPNAPNPNNTGDPNMNGPFLQANGMYRHAGGPIGGGDKYNYRGRPMNSPLGSDEQVLTAQKGEFMMKKKAVSAYGTDFMHQVNNGTFNPGNSGAKVYDIGAIGGPGLWPALAMAQMMSGIIARTVVATGSAMMASLSGGGDIGAINISQKAGKYGNSFLNETQLKTAALIAETAKELGASKRDLTIALMTAFQESQMGTAGMYTEVDHDSIGPFQQRAAWGPRGDRTDIKKSTRMFFLGGQQGQPGLFDIKNRNSMSLNDAAQAVQVSGVPYAYAQWQDEAEAIIAAGVGTDISRRQLANNLKFGNWMTAGVQANANKWANSAVGAGGPMNVQPGEFQHPVPGATVTSEYGMRWGSMHEGIDLGAGTGTPIYATKGGVVTLASDTGDGFGNHVVINHGGGITSGYAHMSRFAVGPGAQVLKGQNIGFVGSTGQSTGPHLHFQLGRGQDGGRYGYTTNPRAFGIPGLAVGGIVQYDDTIANLHKDETVLTAPLSKDLKEGIQNLDTGGGNEYNFKFEMNAPVYGIDHLEEVLKGWTEKVKKEIAQEELDKKRRLGGK